MCCKVFERPGSAIRVTLTTLATSIDDEQHAPVTDADAPWVPVALQFLAPGGAWAIGQRQNFVIYASKQRIVQRIQFLLRRVLDFERVLNHAGVCTSADWRGIARKECPFPSGATLTSD